MKTLFCNCRLVDPSQGLDGPGALLAEDGVILWSGSQIPEGTEAHRTIDCGGCVLAPGLIDLHVHFREPGQTHKETLATGCQAAAAGGYTAVVTMANTTPPIDSSEMVRWTLQNAQPLDCRIFPAAAVTRGMKGQELTDFRALAEAGASCLTDDGLMVARNDVAFAAFKEAAALGLAVSIHPETPGLGGDRSVNQGDVSRRFGLEGVPPAGEETGIARDIVLAEAAGAHLHVQHVSTARGVALIAWAKSRGAHVTAEATPHHISLTEERVLRCGANAKMSPPLRTEADRLAVETGLLDGTLDVIATDHAPHSPEEKAQGLAKAPNGVVGLETALAVCLTELSASPRFSLPLLIDRMSCRPAAVLGLPGGTLKSGSPADLVVFDPKERWTVDASRFRSKGRNTPWDGETLIGRVKLTVLGGRFTWRDMDDARFAGLQEA